MAYTASMALATALAGLGASRLCSVCTAGALKWSFIISMRRAPYQTAFEGTSSATNMSGRCWA